MEYPEEIPPPGSLAFGRLTGAEARVLPQGGTVLLLARARPACAWQAQHHLDVESLLPGPAAGLSGTAGTEGREKGSGCDSSPGNKEKILLPRHPLAAHPERGVLGAPQGMTERGGEKCLGPGAAWLPPHDACAGTD